MGVAEAVDAPRLHAEEGVVYCEDAAVAEALEERGRTVVGFKRRNLFFGGVGAVEVLPDGRLAAAGDPRRGGAGVTVA
jgi:gamma-glutamyltranspeptidase/glutathione hydrolase